MMPVLWSYLTGMHYVKHLSKDATLKALVKKYEPFTLKKSRNICLELCASIMSQQLSGKVARVIYNRFIALFDGNNPTADQILAVSHEQLRSIGLSNAKANYVHNVARFASEQGMEGRMLARMNAEEVITYLTQIKGVGRWTVEMLLIFSLGHEDTFPFDDLGTSSAVIELYNIKTKDKKKRRKKMEEIVSSWAPYRTYASLYLWRWRDDEMNKRRVEEKKKKKKQRMKK